MGLKGTLTLWVEGAAYPDHSTKGLFDARVAYQPDSEAIVLLRDTHHVPNRFAGDVHWVAIEAYLGTIGFPGFQDTLPTYIGDFRVPELENLLHNEVSLGEVNSLQASNFAVKRAACFAL
jgi:hypothetical protein